MLNKLLGQIREYDMIKPGQHIICACSGGADSVALLFGLYLLREQLGFRLSAAHYNHRLRGEESDRDELFVRELCERLDLACFVGSGSIVPAGKGLEAAAREARYDFFSSLDGTVATAHTADDNAETVLLHLVRGTGLKGLGGIAPVRPGLIRPMLTVTRQEVLAFLEEYHLRFVEDGSNGSDAFLRNRLRHHVMPLLRQENPRISENLSHMAMGLRRDEAALAALTAQPMPDVQTLRSMEPALRARVLERFLRDSGVKEPERRHIAMAEQLVFSDHPSARADLPGGVAIARSYDTLTVLREQPRLQRQQVCCPGVTPLPQLGLQLVCEPARQLGCTADCFVVRTCGTVTVRARQSGDQLTGSGGKRSLKKLMIDRKIPARQRDIMPVLCDEQGILGVFGLGADKNRQAQALPAWRFYLREL